MRYAAVPLTLAISTLAGCADDNAPTKRMNPAAAKHFDPRLSTQGVYADLKGRTPVAGALEYEPEYELFSDGASKRRWLILPHGTSIDTSDMDHWQFPVGTTFVKEFSRDGKVLETRLIQRIGTTGELEEQFFMGAFVWSEDGEDAVFTEDGSDDVLGTTHDVPMQDFCEQCHQGEPSAILGFSALQLSKSGLLSRLASKGLLTVDPGRTFAIPGNDVEVRALGALHANCGHCHGETGMGSMMRLQFLPSQAHVPLTESQIYRTTLSQPVTDWMPRPPEFEVRVEPGNPARSALYYRMTLRSGDGFTMDQMPPLATEVHDEVTLEAVRTWIASLPAGPEDASSPDSADDTGVGPVPGASLDGGIESDAGFEGSQAGDGGALDASSDGSQGSDGGELDASSDGSQGSDGGELDASFEGSQGSDAGELDTGTFDAAADVEPQDSLDGGIEGDASSEGSKESDAGELAADAEADVQPQLTSRPLSRSVSPRAGVRRPSGRTRRMGSSSTTPAGPG